MTKIRNIGLGDYGMIINWDFCLKFSGAGLFCCSRGGHLRSLTLNGEDSVGKRILYIRLPHPAVNKNHNQFQVCQA